MTYETHSYIIAPEQMEYTAILLATANPAKQHRLRWLLQGLPLSLATPDDLGLNDQAPDEDGSTHLENARLKAEWWSRAGAMPAISSDGGLVVPALGQMWQSLYTHRSAGYHSDDQSRLEHLIHLMLPYNGDERRVSWVEALAVADGGQVMGSWEVEGANGHLLDVPGPGPTVPGFWVFSLWYLPHLKKTYNELTEKELEALDDHWSRLRPRVRQFFREGRRTGE